MNRARHLLRSSVLVIILFGIGKLTGLGRTFFVSGTFGTSPEFDAFTAANQLPEVFVTLISGGALAAAFIPVYSQYLADRRSAEAARLANTILTLVLLTLTVVSAVGALLAPWLTARFLVPSYSPEQQLLTAQLMRVILIQTTLFGVSGVLSSILNTHQHFALPALAPIALDVGYYVGIFLLVPALGIFGLAWGTVIGGLLHILVQVPALLRYRFRYRPRLAWRLSGVRQVIRLMGPRIVTLGTVQLADLVIINLLSGLESGATSGYFYGYALMQLPETLFGTAIAVVVFPTLAELFNEGRIEELKRTAVNTLKIIWMLSVPAAALIVLLGRPAIALIFERGAFSADSTRLVYTALLFFSVRIVSEATLEIVARLFYAQHDTATPMAAALGWFVVNSVLALWLVGPLGIGGLALASTIAFTLQSALLLWLNARRLGGLGGRGLWVAAGRIGAATAGLALVVIGLGSLPALSEFVAGSATLSTLVRLGLLTATGLAAYLAILQLLGGDEWRQLRRLLDRA